MHCEAGQSRSVTVAAAWMIASNGASWLEACTAIKAARPVSKPNAAFLVQLKEYGWCRCCGAAGGCACERRGNVGGGVISGC